MLHKNFEKHIAETVFFKATDKLLLAVSGGVDSVVLCELCHRSSYVFEIAHAQFGLRGIESEQDEFFVKTLAEKYKVPLHVKQFDTVRYAEEKKVSIQAAARELRYGWFNELLSSDTSWLLTAHHADDNIETVLMNFFRGTGISGMRGILPVTGKIVRPMLPFSKKEIQEFAKENNLEWREDSSNASDKYSRNFFRNAIIPMVSKVFPEAEKNVSENIRRFSDVEVLYRQAIEYHKKNLLEVRGSEVHIPVLKLKKSRPLYTIVYEIIKNFGFTSHQTEKVLHLLDAAQGRMVESASHRIFRNRQWLIISPVATKEADIIPVHEGMHCIKFKPGTIRMRIISEERQQVKVPLNEAVLDRKRIEFPLILRKWRRGDYFYPLGLAKKKKLGRFFIDRKLSPTEKENAWVVESGKRIIWVVGMRIDDRFKVTENTAEIFHMSFDPGE